MLITEEQNKYAERRDFISEDSIDSWVLEKAPDFLDYLFFHNVIDKFCWILKLHYSDRETVKKKKYRIDTLFQRFMLSNKISQENMIKCFSNNAEPGQLEHHLSKGWHNELVRSDPLHPDFLNIGTQIGKWGVPGSGGFAAWNIIQSYYAVFEFMCCYSSAINPSLDTRGHKKVAREFSNQNIGKGKGRLIFYPFLLTSSTKEKDLPSHPDFCQYHYASYPREHGRGICELEYEVQKALALINDRGKSSFLDLLYELRLWANYTGVQSLLKLSDGGYQQFISRNLATIVYFSGGIAELSVLSALGESTYLGMLKRFSSDYIDKHERFAINRFLIPAFIRLRSYKHLGLINGCINFIMPETSDPVQFIEI